MGKRPIFVTLIASLYMISGAIGVIYHFPELKDPTGEALLVLLLRVLAIVGGVFCLRAANWARWLLVAWIAYHVVLSISHETSELIAHLIILALTIWALFHRRANNYFRGL